MYKILIAVLIFVLNLNPGNAQTDLKESFTFYITPDSATAQTSGSWTIVIKAKKEIPQAAQFKLKFIKGFGNLQNLIAIGANYVSAYTNTPQANIQINQIVNSSIDYQSFWEDNSTDRIITFTVRNRSIPAGDSIRIVIGNPNVQSGRAPAPFSAFTDVIEIAAALNGNGQYILSDETATFRIKPMKANTLNLFAQTVFHPGREGKLLISASDMYFNLAENFTGTVFLSGPKADEAQYSRIIEITPADSGKKEIPVTFLKEGNYYFTATTNVAQINIPRSNPVKVSKDHPFIYWGDLHSHGAPSRDAFGTGRYYYARYARGLDFFSATDHVDHNVTVNGISDRDWAFQKQEIIHNYEPGKFVTFIGYESSFLFPVGHYNIIFNAKNENIPNVPIWPMKTFENIQNIWAAADTSNFDIITIPHHCGKVFYTSREGNNCLNCNTFGGIYKNPKYKMLMEIFSNHGLSESYDPQHNLNYTNKASNGKPFNGPYYAQDGWAMGEKLGLISSSDDHFSHPGLPHNGIAAVFANELDRDPLFKGLKNRASYGTTGDRIYIDFRINGEMMGKEITLGKQDSAAVFIEILGTDNIDYAELLKWDFINGTYASGHPSFQKIATFRPDVQNPASIKVNFTDPVLSDSAMYYVRVKQKNFRPANNTQYEVWGWSSPVWINRTDSLTTQDDSLLYYKANQQLRNISHSWAVSHQHQVRAFEVQQLVNENWETIHTVAVHPNSTKYDFNEIAAGSGDFTYRLVVHLRDKPSLISVPVPVHVSIDSMYLKDAQHEPMQIQLGWETHLETHTTSYDIQLFDNNSADFVTIASIPAHLNMSAITEAYHHTFKYQDPGIYTFRVIQNFKNGESSYLVWNPVEVIQTKTETYVKENPFQLLKNPVRIGESATILSDENISGQFWVTDISGRIITAKTRISSVSNKTELNLPAVPPGLYHIHLKTNSHNLSLPIVILP